MSLSSTSHRHAGRHAAFTLVELLIVISIIALLIAILVPAIAQARAQAKSTICASHLNGLFRGVFFYAQDNADRLPNFSSGHNSVGLHWTTQILPFIDVDMSVFVCPSDRKPFTRFLHGSNAGAGYAGSTRVRGGAGGAQGKDLLVKVSYDGACDTLTSQMWVSGNGLRVGYLPSRISHYRFPSRDIMLTEVERAKIETDNSSCFNWNGTASAWRTDPSFRRHFGGTSLNANGSNFLFLDGHASWHSAQGFRDRLVCFQRRGGSHKVSTTCASKYPYPNP